MKFHGPEEKLNNIIHEAYKDHRCHQMLPLNLSTELEKIGFKNIQTTQMAFLITQRNKNSFATYAGTTLVNLVKGNVVAEEDVKLWQSQ